MDEKLLNYLKEQDVLTHMGFRILLVDDEEDNLFLLKSFLEDDYDIYTSLSGEAGLELLAEQEVDLLIVDQRMDGMDGLTFCEEASKVCPNSIRMILTAFSDREMLLAAMRSGKIFRVMTKPWNFVEIEAAVEEAFKKLAYQRAFSNLIEELHSKNQDLEAAYKQLREEQEARLRSERLAAVGEVTSRITHEMSNQLAIFSLLKANRQVMQSIPQVGSSIDFVIEATENLFEMVSLLKQFTKGVSPTLECSNVDVRELLSSTIRFVQQSPIADGAEFAESYDDVSTCWLDRRRIKQVFLNILRNAIQSMEDDPKVWVSVAQPSQEWVTVAIRDQGEGIPDEIASKVFEPFFTTKSHEGLGLGLDVCKQIVEQHGGSISFQSVAQKGTTFSITLPAKGEQSDGESISR